MNLRFLAVAMLFATNLSAATLPGFRTEMIGKTVGFATSIALDSQGTIYYTSKDGSIFRMARSESIPVARVPSYQGEGDAGLLGMALIDDRTAAVHYSNRELTREIISRIDLITGHELVLVSFINDLTGPDRPVSAEHHGGNPTVADDGSIFFAIGDFGGGTIASLPEWSAGKIWRILPGGGVEQFARGVRNSYDLAWDPAGQRIIMSENGPVQGDEINIVHKGDNLGWPFSWGNHPAVGNSVAPHYVFPETVAPTGVVRLNDRNPMLRGYLFGSFSNGAISLVPNIDAKPLPPPLPLIEGETRFVIDVAQAANGDVYFTSGEAIYRLVQPTRGDCNGDRLVNSNDVYALMEELREGVHPTLAAAEGAHRGSFGCDTDGNGTIDSRDLATLLQTVHIRRRAISR